MAPSKAEEFNMIIERDVGIVMDDGLTLRADVFRPANNQPAPVIMSHGPYGKGVEWKTGWAASWEWFCQNHPDALAGSTRSFECWEVVDPEVWTAQYGYVVVRVDSRGAGRSPGYLDTWSPREIKDFYNAIEWGGTQPWSTGKVGLSGISYYAMTQWLVASLQPPHLTAMIPWEASADYYRDSIRHGGILSNGFMTEWYERQVVSVQHGNPTTYTDPWLNERASGPATLSPEELRANRLNPMDVAISSEVDSQYNRDRSPVWSKVTVPFLSCGNWGGQGLHQRGNLAGFLEAASTQKWLEMHPGKHEEWFYLNYGVQLQKRFFDHFLKGVDNAWEKERPVRLNIRRPFSQEFQARMADQWPLENTDWTKVHFDAANQALSWTANSKQEEFTFDALGEPLILQTAPLERETEITGPMAVKLFISSTTTDADIFLTLQAFSPDGQEVEFQGSHDPHTPLAQGWLRASHRKLDPPRTKPYRPYHSHDEPQPLELGKVYELDIEVWATCIVLPAGFTLALRISGRDFERGKPWGPRGMDGSGPFRHTQRPAEKFGGQTTVYTGGSHDSYMLLPVIQTV